MLQWWEGSERNVQHLATPKHISKGFKGKHISCQSWPGKMCDWDKHIAEMCQPAYLGNAKLDCWFSSTLGDYVFWYARKVICHSFCSWYNHPSEAAWIGKQQSGWVFRFKLYFMMIGKQLLTTHHRSLSGTDHWVSVVLLWGETGEPWENTSVWPSDHILVPHHVLTPQNQSCRGERPVLIKGPATPPSW